MTLNLPMRSVPAMGLMSVLLCLASALTWSASGESATPEPVKGLALEIASPIHDFGKVHVGEPLEHEFELRNLSDSEPLEVINVQPSCGCTVAKDFDRLIEPGQVGKIPVTLNTRTLHNKFSKRITVTTSDPEKPQVFLELRGEVSRAVEAEPRSLNFGDFEPGKEVEQSILIKNNTDQPLELELQEGLLREPFTARLEEVEEGKLFKLHVKATPPFPSGRAYSPLAMKTNIEEEPVVRATAIGYLREAIEVTPNRMVVGPTRSRPVTWMFTVRNNEPGVHALKDVTTNAAFLELTVQEATEGREWQILATVPAEFKPEPKEDEKLQIAVRFEGEEEDSLVIPVVQMP